jgi:eukaryotic-like serine/threonine-protein kinase
MKITTEQWQTLSRLLDEALDLPPDAQETWLECLAADHLALKPLLRDMLARQAIAETAALIDTLPKVELLTEAEAQDANGLRAHDEVGPYRLLRPLGRGGMGEVWLAERSDGFIKRPIALKLPYPGAYQRQLAERFARERDILAGLTHPNIARLYDAGITSSGQPFLALEYVEGSEITAYCDGRKLTVRQRIELFLQVLHAVQYAHANLVIHRDLKPSNILVTPQGEVRLLDFGIAKLSTDGQANETALTQVGGRIMTPHYASPEQVAGLPVSTASDVYSLGVLLYELLTGERPYKPKHASRASLEEAILKEEQLRLSQVVKTGVQAQARQSTPQKLARMLRGDLDTIVLKALKKKPEERYATVNAFADDLERYLRGDAVLAQPDSTWYRTRKFVSRNRFAVAAVSGIIAALAVGLGVALWQASVATREAQAAIAESKKSAAVQRLLVETFSQIVSDRSSLSAATTASMNEVLENKRREAQAIYQKEPTVRAQVMNVLGTLWSYLEQPERSISAFNGQLDALRESGASNIQQAAVFLHMGLAERTAGSAGGQYFEQAMALLNGEIGPEATETRSKVIHHYADWLIERDKLDAAERVLDKVDAELMARIAHTTALGGIEYARGRLQMRRGQPEQALKSYESAAQVLAEAPDRDKDLLISLYHTIGHAYMETGGAGAAEKAFRQAVALERAAYGTDRLSVADALINLSEAINERGKYAEAIAVLDEAYDVARKSKADARAEMLAKCLVVQLRTRNAFGDLTTARTTSAELQRQMAEGGSNIGSATRRNALAVLARYRMEIGEYEASKALLRERARLSASATVTLASNFAVARVAAAQGALQEAQQLLDETDKQLPPTVPEVLRQQQVTAAATTALAKRDYAKTVALLEPYLAEKLAANRKAALASHEQLEFRVWLARALIGLSRLDAAGQQLSEAKSLADEQHPNSPRLGAYLSVLGLLQLAQGKADEASHRLDEAIGVLGENRKIPHQSVWTEDLFRLAHVRTSSKRTGIDVSGDGAK